MTLIAQGLVWWSTSLEDQTRGDRHSLFTNRETQFRRFDKQMKRTEKVNELRNRRLSPQILAFN